MPNLQLNFDQGEQQAVIAVCDPAQVKPAKLQTDCLLVINPYSGFNSEHSGRCPNAPADPNPHLTSTTHHVRINGSCMLVCSACADKYGKRRDAIVREL